MGVSVGNLINKVPASERDAFATKVAQVSANIGVQPKDLMAIMDLESAGTFDPTITNSLGYTGLIQFGAQAAKDLGTTTADLKKMTRVQQLDYVQKYFQLWKKRLGISSFNDFVDMYLTVLYPAGIKEMDQNKPIMPQSVANANSGLKDVNGNVTKNSIRAVYANRYQGLFDKAIQLASEGTDVVKKNPIKSGLALFAFVVVVGLIAYAMWPNKK
jgi:hypothetical protein